MKKILCFIMLILAMNALILVSCGGGTGDGNDDGTGSNGGGNISPDGECIEHTVTVDPGYAATCNEPGMTDGEYCSVCGEVLTEKTEISPLKHDKITIPAVDPTCTSVGYTAGKSCSRCPSVFVEPQKVAKLSHTYGENGRCTVCGDNITSVFIFTKADDGESYVITGTRGTLPEKLTIPSTYNGLPVTRVSEDAIKDSSTLKELIFPDSLKTIDRGAVINCQGLTSVTLPFASIQAYQGQRRLSSVFDANTLRSLKHVTVSSSKKIMEYAFSNCPSLESVHLPADTESIGYGVFYDSPKVKTITVDPANEHYYVENSCIISYDGVLVSGCNASTIPASGKIKEIAPYAFACCNFTEITIPQSVEKMGVASFENCKYLTKITLPFVGHARESTTYDHLGFIFGANYPDQSDCIPTSLKEVTVYDCHSIYNEAFAYCESIEKVTLDSAITYMGDYAFIKCSALKEIVFGESFKGFGNATLRDAPSGIGLTVSENNPLYYSVNNVVIERATKTLVLGNGSAMIPSDGSVTSIGSNALSGYGLTSITLPNSVVSIGDGAFSYSKLTSITLPDSVVSIGDGAFRYSKLTRITAPCVTSIGNEAFKECTALTDTEGFTLLTSIGNSAFYNCTNLKSLPVSESLRSIGSSAFYNCSSLSALPCGNNIESIGESAFEGCTALTEAILPDSLTSIGAKAFKSCILLTKAATGNSVCELPEEIFYGCTSLSSLTLGSSVTSIDTKLIYRCSGLTSLVLPDSLTTIKTNALAGAPLTSLSLGASLSPDSASQIPKSVTELSLSEDNEAMEYINGWLVSTDERKLVWGLDMIILNITAEDNIKVIGKDAFKGSQRLYAVSLEGVEVIESRAFYYCEKLNELTLFDGLKKIGASAFSDCTELKAVTVPNSVEVIEESAFAYCSSLNFLSVPFIGGSKTENCYLGYIFGSTNSYTNGGRVPTSLKTVHITGEITEICENAFKECRSIVTITFPNTVSSIGASAFYECEKLTAVTIPKGVTKIEYRAFYNCESLTEIVIPDTVESIGDEAFSYSFALKRCYIPESVKSIGYKAFSNCREVTISYGGTAEQWNAVAKNSYWSDSTTISVEYSVEYI